MSYCRANPPKQYIVRKVLYSCNSCGMRFPVLYSQGNDIVKYVAVDGEEERWLPVFGEGGYLYLLERLLPDYSQNQEVTMDISRRFEKEFVAIQRFSSSGKPFRLFVRAKCPACGSTDLSVLDELLLDSPLLEWMEYQLDNS